MDTDHRRMRCEPCHDFPRSPWGSPRFWRVPAVRPPSQPAISRCLWQDYVAAAAGIWQDDSAEALAARGDVAQRMQESIAACMSHAGFEYIPYLPADDGRSRSVRDIYDLLPASLSQAREYGYGLVYGPGGAWENAEQSQDPNQAYVDSLTDAQRTAYVAAMDGDPATDLFTEGMSLDAWNPTGCATKARKEIEAPTLIPATRFASDVFDALGRIADQVNADPQLAEARTAWSTCMADAGHTGYSDPVDALQGSEAALGKLREESGGKLTDQQLTEFAAHETQLAVADVQCRQDTGYTGVRQERQRHYEDEYVLANQADLEAWVLAADQRRAELGVSVPDRGWG